MRGQMSSAGLQLCPPVNWLASVHMRYGASGGVTEGTSRVEFFGIGRLPPETMGNVIVAGAA